jgi:hypothetical protein
LAAGLLSCEALAMDVDTFVLAVGADPAGIAVTSAHNVVPFELAVSCCCLAPLLRSF